VKHGGVTECVRGLRLQGSHHHRLIDHQGHHHGDSTGHTGYGIAVAGGATANVLQGNRVPDHADAGLQVGAGSDQHTLIRTHGSANFREHIDVLRSNGGVCQHPMTHGGVHSRFLTQARFPRCEHHPFHDRTAALRGDSHDHQVVRHDGLKAGLPVQASQEGATRTRPTRHVVAGGTIVAARPWVRCSGASGHLIQGIRLSRGATAVVSTGGGTSIENMLIRHGAETGRDRP
jgi:hypothetical protein